MRIRKTGQTVRIDCPAKLNLFLEVHGRRPDGFHELETVMVPVTIFDTLFFTPNSSGLISLTCRQVAGMRGTDANPRFRCECGT